MPEPTIFGRRVKELREKRRWTQADVEQKSGVPAAMISHFETGTRQKASADNLVKLANAFHVSIDYLLGRSDEPQLSGERFAAAFRGLADSSDETVDNALTMVESLVERERRKREQEEDGSEGANST